MGRLQFSTRALIAIVAVVGFDAAAMSRALHQGRAAHAVPAYLIGFGLVLLILNLVGLGLMGYLARSRESVPGGRLNATPPPLVILALYVGVVALAILSVLFFSSGLF